MSGFSSCPGDSFTSGLASVAVAELVRCLPVCLGVYDLTGRCILASEALARWLQRPLAEVLGRHIEQLWPDGFGTVLLARHAPARAGGSAQAVEELPCGPVRRAVSVRRFAWRGETGEVQAVIETFEEAVASSQAEAVGRLALGLAQDFSNALALLLGHLDLLEATLGGNSRGQRLLSELRLLVRHAGELPRQLLRFIQGGPAGWHPVDLNTLLSSLERLLRPRLARPATLRLELASGGAWVEGDPVQLTQVLLDLASQGLSTLPPGGQLLLRCEQVPGGPGGEAVEQGPHVRITIRHAGQARRAREGPHDQGLPPLALVQEMVRGHGGTVQWQTTPGQPASFQVLLPLRSGRATRQGEAGSPAGTAVLVLERNPDIRQLAGMILAHGQFTPVLCGDFHEARQMSNNPQRPVRLIVVDAELCAGQGVEELADLLARQRQARLLFTSAGEGVPQDVPGLRRPGSVLLKPFRAEQLLRAVEAALAE